MEFIEYPVKLTIDEHWLARKITGDEQEVHKNPEKAALFLGREGEVIVQGIQLIELINSFPPIKGSYKLRREVEFMKNSAVGIKVDNGEVNLTYGFREFHPPQSPVTSYEVIARDDSRTIFTGRIYITRFKDVYDDIVARKPESIFKYQGNGQPKIGEIKMNPGHIDDLCKAIHISREDYDRENGESFSNSYISMKSIGSLVNIIGDIKEKKYIFKKQVSENYSVNSKSEIVVLYGENYKKMAMNKVSSVAKDCLGNMLIGSETIAFAA
jgi:hypothetical protein